jgi:hypothetical protein
MVAGERGPQEPLVWPGRFAELAGERCVQMDRVPRLAGQRGQFQPHAGIWVDPKDDLIRARPGWQWKEAEPGSAAQEQPHLGDVIRQRLAQNGFPCVLHELLGGDLVAGHPHDRAAEQSAPLQPVERTKVILRARSPVIPKITSRSAPPPRFSAIPALIFVRAGHGPPVFHVCGRALTRLPLLPMLAVRAACHIPWMASGHWPGRACAGAWAAWKASSAWPGVSK